MARNVFEEEKAMTIALHSFSNASYFVTLLNGHLTASGLCQKEVSGICLLGVDKFFNETSFIKSDESMPKCKSLCFHRI